MIKRKWPKIDRGGPRAPSESKGSAGGLRLGPPLVSWPVPSLRSPPGKAVGSSAKRQASRGARQPGPPLVSQRFQAAFWAPFPHPTQGVAEAQIPPRTAGGLGRGSPRWHSRPLGRLLRQRCCPRPKKSFRPPFSKGGGVQRQRLWPRPAGRGKPHSRDSVPGPCPLFCKKRGKKTFKLGVSA